MTATHASSPPQRTADGEKVSADTIAEVPVWLMLDTWRERWGHSWVAEEELVKDPLFATRYFELYWISALAKHSVATATGVMKNKFRLREGD